MKETATTKFCQNQFEEADDRMSALFLEHTRYGFFELHISGTIGKNGKRKVVINAGKSYQYTIPEEDIPKTVKSYNDSCDLSVKNDIQKQH